MLVVDQTRVVRIRPKRSNANLVYRYDEGDIEKRGATWLYAKNKVPPPKSDSNYPLYKRQKPLFCPTALLLKNEKKKGSSCLQLIEKAGDIGGLVDVPPSCHVTNICTDGNELPEIEYALMLKPSKKQCGREPVFPVILSPGETREHVGYLNCCISMEKKTTNVLMKEPGNCLSVRPVRDGNAVWKNVCKYTINVYSSLPKSRYFTFNENDEFNIGIGASETLYSSKA